MKENKLRIQHIIQQWNKCADCESTIKRKFFLFNKNNRKLQFLKDKRN